MSELHTVQSGLLLKDFVKYDENHLELAHQKLQFPFELPSFKWRGFFCEEVSNYNFDESITFYSHGKSKRLYISQESSYEDLPTTQEELTNDDADDWTFQRLSDGDQEGRDPDYDADLRMNTNTICIKLKKENIDEIEKYLENSPATKAKTITAEGFIFKNFLAYTDKWAFAVKVHWLKEHEVDNVPIKYMAFFSSSRIPYAPTRSGLYCGYHRQLQLKSLKITELDEFKKWCMERAPRLDAKGSEYKSAILPHFYNPTAYFNKDKITLTEEAVVYTRKTLMRDEMIYLPYKRVNISINSNGLFFSRVEMYGEQNIVPNFKFSKNDVNTILETLKTHDIRPTNGQSYNSTLLFPNNWFGRAPRIIITENDIIYYPNRASSYISKKGVKVKIVRLPYENIDSIDWYKKLFRPFGSLIIDGHTDNIRNDQGDKSARIYVPGLFCFKYKFLFFFSGPLRKTLTSHHEDEINYSGDPYGGNE